MEQFQNQKFAKTISELNEDCEILIKKEIEKALINYGIGTESQKSLEISEICSELKVDPPETRQLYFSPSNRPASLPKDRSDRTPKMLLSSSITSAKQPRLLERRSFLEHYPKRYVDEPTQATCEKNLGVPRSTVLSRTRQILAKRNSYAQSKEIKYKTVKTQTDNLARTNIAISVEPLDFLGLFEKSTNHPCGGRNGQTRDQATQMYNHITQSELFCIEWIHKNLFEVKINPNTLVVDDRLRDHSESAVVT